MWSERRKPLTFKPVTTTTEQLLKAYLSLPFILDGKKKSKKKPPLRVLHRKYVFEETGEEVPYAVAVPGGPAPPGQPLGLLLALHGLHYPYDWALQLPGLLELAHRHHLLVVAPLGYTDDGWYGCPDLARGGVRDDRTRRSEADVLHVLRRVRSEWPVDGARLYAWGFSMGGAGALHFALKQPRLFRGVGLVAPAVGAGGGAPPWTREATVDLASLADVAVAVVYGTEDRPVEAETVRGLLGDLRAAGVRRVHAAEVEGGRHDCEELVGGGRLRQMLEFMLGPAPAAAAAPALPVLAPPARGAPPGRFFKKF